MENQTKQQNNEQPVTVEQTEQQPVCEQFSELHEGSEVLPDVVTEKVSEADFLPSPTSDAAAKKRSKAVDVVLTVALIVMILVSVTVILLRSFVVCRISVSGESMLPNFHNGQIVWVDKRDKTLQRGDVVVLYKKYVKNKFLADFAIGQDKKSGGKYEKLIKRVVALEGDKLWLEKRDSDYVLVIQTPQGEILYENSYTVDGRPAQFFTSTGELTDIPTLGFTGRLTDSTQENPFVVMEGYFFFMGDNRHNSSDSRTLGALPLNRLYGKVL